MNSSRLPDKFDKIRELGSGAFGVVFLVQNKMLNRTEAIKIITFPEDISNEPKFSYRQEEYIKEAKSLEDLRHRNVVNIYESGYLQSDDGIYISMEYVDGGSIEDQGFLSILDVKKINLNVLSALAYAHSKGYVHRDIKPSNILLTNQGRAKLSDFGIATHIDVLTKTATPKGYVKHMPPECIIGKGYSFLSDIYQMGVTMYRMINGDPPYIQKISGDKLKRTISQGEYPPRNKYSPETPKSLVRLINKSLKTNPKERFQTAMEMRKNLSKIKVECEWVKEEENEITKWFGHTEEKEIKLVSYPNEGKIVTKQRKESSKFRRIRNLCFDNLTPHQADEKLGVILRGFTSGRLQ